MRQHIEACRASSLTVTAYCKEHQLAPSRFYYWQKRWLNLNRNMHGGKLCVYTGNGILQIDNNLVENSIRPVALGRKNYLFAGSHERAQDAAMLYSLFATCRLHNSNPEQWLTHFFEKINSTSKEQLHQLLPQNFALVDNKQ